ncbi:merozoite surface protein 7 [Plasmodium gonderi]|uniref:Merozoite surface protein 7 n=1 Tax=Plasmodium gonderi TaxID=77519 RepID=A0A1Y1JQ70_PLAGO|nr:merozoite surface protein 7 [Plasmodium gonderi]GAW82214.1 merozoite surface protein 7 [Plasmodium gonderi]
MRGYILLLAAVSLTSRVVLSIDNTPVNGKNYKKENEDSQNGDEMNNMMTTNEESGKKNILFSGQGITKYFKNIIDEFSTDSNDEHKEEAKISSSNDSTSNGTNSSETEESSSNQKIQGESFGSPYLKYSDELYEDIMLSLNKKDDHNGKDYDDKYKQFKKDYDMFISLSKEEYEIIEKLVDAFSMHNDAIDEDADSVYEAITKSITDPKFRQDFKDFMDGIYSYAKRKNNMRGGKTTELKMYLNLFENVINLLNML